MRAGGSESDHASRNPRLTLLALALSIMYDVGMPIQYQFQLSKHDVGAVNYSDTLHKLLFTCLSVFCAYYVEIKVGFSSVNKICMTFRIIPSSDTWILMENYILKIYNGN